MFRIGSLLCALLIVACGKMPANYDQMFVDCGEMDAENSTSLIVQVVDEQGPIRQEKLTAQWLSEGQEAPLTVSSRSCIPLPKGEGSLKVISSDRRRGLLLKNPSRTIGTPFQVGLKPLREGRLGFSCESRVPLAPLTKIDNELYVKQIEDIGLNAKWTGFDEDDSWQFVSLQLLVKDLATQTTIQTLSLVQQNLFLNEAVLLPHSALKDGKYSLNLEVVTLASRFNSADSCVVNLDTVPPEKKNLLREKIYDGLAPLPLSALDDDGDLFTCIAPPDEACQKFSKADAYLKAPASGSYVLHSYRVDAAGNRSAMNKETFYRDEQAPSIRLRWVDPALEAGDGWVTERDQSHRIQAIASDDSSQSDPGLQEELNKTLECTVEIIAPNGSKSLGEPAICSEGICKGLHMDDWVPCSGDFAVFLQNEWSLTKSKIVVKTRVKDRLGREAQSSVSFWLNRSALGGWTPDSGLILDLSAQGLRFLQDTPWGALIFQPTGSFDESAAFYIRSTSGNHLWKRKDIQSNGGALAPFTYGRALMSESFDSSEVLPSVWLSALSDWTFAEVVTDMEEQGQYPLVAKVREITPSIQAQLGETRKVMQIIEREINGTRELVLLLASSDPLENDAALVSFTPPDRYEIIAQTFGDQILRTVHGMALGPKQSVIVLLGDGLMIQDAGSPSFRTLTSDSRPVEGIASLATDEKGIYGLTTDKKLFAIDFDENGKIGPFHLLENSGLRNIEQHRIERQSTGTYWVSGPGVDHFYFFRPGLDTSWQKIYQQWGWPSANETTPIFTSFGVDFGIDKEGRILTANPSGLSQSVPCDFIDVTEQGLFRTEIELKHTRALRIDQDASSQIWRANSIGKEIFIGRLDSDAEKMSTAVKFTSPLTTAEEMDAPKLMVDPADRLWLWYNSGRMFTYAPTSNTAVYAFNMDPAQNAFFDRFGNFWTQTQGVLNVRTPQGEVKRVSLPGLLKKMGSWDHDAAWLVVDRGDGRETLYELKLESQEMTQGSPLPDPSFRYADLVQINSKRMAVLWTTPASSTTSALGSELQIYEQSALGWVKSQMQVPSGWPPWHPLAGLSIKLRTIPKMFFEASAQAYWLSLGSYVGRFKEGQWKFFHPSHSLQFETPIENFWTDRRGRLTMNSNQQVFYYNRACYTERTDLDKKPPAYRF